MKAWSVILFFLCFNAAGYIIGQLAALNVLSLAKSEMPYGVSDISSAFSLNVFSANNIGFGLLGAGIGAIIGIITKQYVFATGIILVWLVGTFLNLTNWILNGFPTMLNILLAGTGLEFIAYVVESITLAIFFMFLAGILSQRPDLT